MEFTQEIPLSLIVSMLLLAGLIFTSFSLYKKLRLPVVLLSKDSKNAQRNFQKLEFLVWGVFVTIVLYYALKSSILITFSLLLIGILAFFSFWKNYFSGIALKFSSNFDMGDAIVVNGNSGTVIEWGNTNLRLLSTSGEEILLPYSSIQSEVKIQQKSIPDILFKTMIIEGQNDSSFAYKQRLLDLLKANPWIIVTKPYTVSVEGNKTNLSFFVLDHEMYEKAKHWLYSAYDFEAEG